MSGASATGPAPGERAGSVDEVVDLLATYGTERYDEDVTQLEHGLQCAALAAQAGASDELVAAALLHDVGHLLVLAGGGRFERGADDRHEERGARWLAGVFGPGVTGPVAAHVRAKRHLAAVDPDYVGRLSPASLESLRVQGGPLDADDAAAFAADPVAGDAVALRRWDDTGKVEGLDVPGLDAYLGILARSAASRPAISPNP